jgi:hypothetical protein
MWRMISRLAPATLALTVAFAGPITSESRASAVLTDSETVQPYGYTSSGSISSSTSASPIGFIGLSGTQTLTTPGTFSLGQFDAAGILPATATLTYNNTPFTIDLNVASGTGSGFYTYLISGTLNGSITGAGSSTMVATVSSITGQANDANGVMTTPPFPASDIVISVPQGITAPDGTQDGYTTLYGQVIPGAVLGAPSPAPEPASIAVFAVGLAAWGIRRRMSRSKA